MRDGPADTAADGIYFDGVTSRRRSVRVHADACLTLWEDGQAIAHWAWQDLRPLTSNANGGPLRLTSVRAADGAKLLVSDEKLAREISARCPALFEEAQSSRSFFAKIVVASAAALLSLGGLLWFGIPYGADRLAPLVPLGWEKRLGDAADRQVRTLFSAKTCTGTGGRAALNKLTEALLRPSSLPMPVTIEVLSSPVPNAFALPGGKVYVLRGLLEKSNNVDELAGVLAHELGHVRHRDTLRRMIAEGSTAYLVGLLFGDVSGAGALLFTGRTLLGAAYSRDAEANADAHALSVMTALGRPAKSMGELLMRIDGKSSPGVLDILRDHPLSADRLAALSHGSGTPIGPPLLTDDEWHALQAICR